MLILKNISKQYEGSKNLTLENINIKFEATGLVSIIGPSGCGKTTLLNLIGGLDLPTSGKIILNEKDLTRLSKKELNKYHNQHVGFIYQAYNLINYLNVVENVELINKLKYRHELLEYLHLDDKKNSKIKNLSGGEKQRVAIARSLANDPSILLADEPTGALDIKRSHEIMKLIKNISKNKLVIMVTHNEELASIYSDRIIKLEDGKIISDTKKEIVNDYSKYETAKIRISFLKIFNIIINNIKSKYKRNVMSILAFSVGLISLTLVLGLSYGFNKSMENEERESLSKYPIFISETSTNLDKDLKRIITPEEKTEEDYIYSSNTEHKNIIDKNYIDDLKSIDNNLNYKINTYIFDNKIITISDKEIKELKIIKGRGVANNNELLLVTNNNKINKNILLSIGLKNEKYSYDELIDYEFKIRKAKYKIVGIASLEEDSYLSNIEGLLKVGTIPEDIPISISLYPKDYENKTMILNHLDKYEDIEYTDYSSTIKSLSKTILNGITIVLIGFSAISLLVSTIMIGITSYISVLERIKEIGLFKSLGLPNRYIKIIFIGENIILAIISSLFSMTLSSLISLPINNLLTNFTGMENIFLINKDSFLILLTISILLSMVGSYLPIRKTNKLKITDCLKHE